MPKHTPTPWIARTALDSDGLTCKIVLETQDGANIGEISPIGHSQKRGESNAAFIVRAVNSHDNLIAALREAQAALSVFPNIDGIYSRIDAAIKLAETGE